MVRRDAPTEVIAASYRALAKKYHPDTNRDPRAGVLMQYLNRAWEILGDPQKRNEYDAALARAEAEWEACRGDWNQRHREEELWKHFVAAAAKARAQNQAADERRLDEERAREERHQASEVNRRRAAKVVAILLIYGSSMAAAIWMFYTPGYRLFAGLLVFGLIVGAASISED